MTGKAILITGASGFVGLHVCKAYLADGYNVHLLLRDSAKTSHIKTHCDGAIVHICPKTSEGFVELLAEIKPALVIHLASKFVAEHNTSDINDLISSNVEFGCQLVDAMAQCGVKNFINTGTSWQHFRDQDFLPVNLYAATKQAFESLLAFYADAFEMNIVTLSLFDTYGPLDERGKLISALLDAARQGRQLSMSPGEQLLDLVHVSDIASAFQIAGSKLLSGELNGLHKFGLSSGQNLSLKQVVDIVSKATNMPVHIHWGDRAYRSREVFEPWQSYAPLEGWTPKIELEAGLRSLSSDG